MHFAQVEVEGKVGEGILCLTHGLLCVGHVTLKHIDQLVYMSSTLDLEIESSTWGTYRLWALHLVPVHTC